MTETYTLPRSKIQFFPNGEAEIRYAPKNFLGDLIDVFDYRDSRDKLKEDLIENAQKARDTDWLNEPENRRIGKKDFITAITKSLEQDPTDGLSSIVESETVCEEEGNSTSENDHSELKDCFKKNWLTKELADKLSGSIIEHAWDKADFNSSAVRHDFIKDLAANYDRGTWKDFVVEKMEQCSKEHSLEVSPFFKTHNDAIEFLDCVVNEIQGEKDNLYEPYFDHCRDAFLNEWNLNDEKHLKELSEETGVPLDLIEHCTHFGYDVLEKYRPIKENQTFLESFGAQIWEPSENNDD